MPGSSTASTWSPGRSTARVLGELRAAVPHDRDQARPVGQRQPGDALARGGRVAVDLQLDDLEVLLAELEQADDPVLGHLVLDEPEDVRGRADGLRDPEQVEVLLVARIVDPGDDLGDAVALARELADDQVVLVVAGHGEDELRRPGDPGQLEHVELGRVAEQHLMLELLLELLEARRALLDQRHLVPPRRSERATFAPTLPPPATIAYIRRSSPPRRLRTRVASSEIAVCVGQTVSIPRSA